MEAPRNAGESSGPSFLFSSWSLALLLVSLLSISQTTSSRITRSTSFPLIEGTKYGHARSQQGFPTIMPTTISCVARARGRVGRHRRKLEGLWLDAVVDGGGRRV